MGEQLVDAPAGVTGPVDQTQAYCLALLNQEKSLEDLQKHLHRTEELFRESVQRKNQQLDLLQSEVRRLKSSVSTRESVGEQLDVHAQLAASHAELARTQQELATLGSDTGSVSAKLSQLKLELSEERAKRQANEAALARTTHMRNDLDEQRLSNGRLRDELAQAQAAAQAAELRLKGSAHGTEEGADEVEALRSEVESKEDELAVLRNTPPYPTPTPALPQPCPPPTPTPPPPPPPPPNRLRA